MATATPAQVTPERIMQMAWGYVPPLVLEAAIRHRVFDVLDSGPKNIWEVEKATGASRRGLSAIMNALVGLEFLSKDEQGRYALTPESDAFLVSTKPFFQGGLIKHCSEHLIPRWLHLNDVVATGTPVSAVNDEQAGGEFFHNFVLDIFPMSYPAAQALAAEMNFGSSGAPVKVLDLAAGSGVWGIAVAQSSPRVQVTAVDWPEVIDVTKKTSAQFGFADRSPSSKATCSRRPSAPATPLPPSATSYIAKARRAAASFSPKPSRPSPAAAPSPSRNSSSTRRGPAQSTASSSPSTCSSTQPMATPGPLKKSAHGSKKRASPIRARWPHPVRLR
jgi:hypothetical protein